ncbi:MAG: hypothetical protein B6I20_10470 [Bacteroidetes bacterium 4572_117]|nr:MAG: hypothetical protein B6I20_10470 [Bacteroidetes bacterium 4572_117]
MYLYIDEYLMIRFNKELSLLKIEWKAESTRLNAESLKIRIDYVYDYFAKHAPKYVLTDCSNLVYRQFNGKEDFLIKKIGSEINSSKIDKLAIVNSTDNVTHALINRLVLNFQHKKSGAKAFTNSISAQSWLMSRGKQLVAE